MDFLFSAFADEANPNFPQQIAALKRNNYQYIELRNVDGEKLTAVTHFRMVYGFSHRQNENGCLLGGTSGRLQAHFGTE